LSIQIALSERRVTSGKSIVPITYAAGVVLLKNKTDHTLNLSAGLRLASGDGLIFETLQGVILHSGQSQSAAVRAAKPGRDGNLPSGALNRTEGPLQLSLDVTNTTAMSGGTSGWRSIVAASDLDSLRETLSQKTTAEAVTGLATLAGQTQMIAAGSLKLDFDPRDAPEFQAGTPADTVGLTVHTLASVLACPVDVLRSAAQSRFSEALAPGESLFADSLSLSLSADPLTLTATARAARIPDPEEVIQAIKAQKPAQAVAAASAVSVPDRMDPGSRILTGYADENPCRRSRVKKDRACRQR
jgi:hypothetical protein